MNLQSSPHRKQAVLLGLVASLCFSGCQSSQQFDNMPQEEVQAKPWQETISVQGEIKTASNTKLDVPGMGWSMRQLTEMVPEGSFVEKGQVIARFDAPNARLLLSQAELEMLRKELAELNVEDNLKLGKVQLNSETTKVQADLSLSQRYANMDLSIFAKNKILDYLIDTAYLKDKEQFLKWKSGQIPIRTQADKAVLLSQKETVSGELQKHKKSLSDLNLRAPHDGIFTLVPRWDGGKPQIGGQMWSGMEFASLPDLEQQIISFNVPEIQGQGLKEGAPVKVRFAGNGLELNLQISRVANNASTLSRESPVKYTVVEAKLDLAEVKKHGLKPGQSVQGNIQVVNQSKVMSVPNIALIQEAQEHFVMVKQGNQLIKKKVELGLRGAVRSEVKQGLSAGQSILLTPQQLDKKENTKGDKKDDKKDHPKDGKEVEKAKVAVMSIKGNRVKINASAFLQEALV
jgi:HlyD family secretion protein